MAAGQELPVATPRERPIIFGTAMVQLILGGRKTQTRRLVRIPSIVAHDGETFPLGEGETAADSTTIVRRKDGVFRAWMSEYPEEGGVDVACPYGQTGDRLWVRESWWHHQSAFIDQAGFLGGTITRLGEVGGSYNANDEFSPARHPNVWRKRSAMYMPRWASRLVLEVVDIRVQRLQEISDEDARAEGFEPVRSFARVWDDVNGERAPWATNPWVWAISFRRLP